MSEKNTMIERILPGMFAVSKAGHDKNHLYIIIDNDETYVYLADGKNKTVSKPKKKKYKHIQVICSFDAELKQKLDTKETVTDEEVAETIKKFSR